MEDPKGDRWLLALMPLIAVLAAFRFRSCSTRFYAEAEEHPETWPIRQALFFAVAIAGYRLIKPHWDRDKETDPFGKRLLRLAACFVAWGTLIGVLMLLDRSVP